MMVLAILFSLKTTEPLENIASIITELSELMLMLGINGALGRLFRFRGGHPDLGFRFRRVIHYLGRDSDLGGGGRGHSGLQVLLWRRNVCLRYPKNNL